MTRWLQPYARITCIFCLMLGMTLSESQAQEAQVAGTASGPAGQAVIGLVDEARGPWTDEPEDDDEAPAVQSAPRSSRFT
ncbi:MAG: hypothetical protein ACRECY_11055, partial [Phyllobacterium sp.]